MNKPLIFRGGGGGDYKARNDTLATNDVVEVLLGLAEGPIQGPINGPQSFFLDSTPLVAANGEPNYSAFSLDFWPGSPTGDTVAMLTGGFSSPVSVGQNLAYNVPVARQGLQTNITAVDFGIVISNLQQSNEKGTNVENLELLFEYQPQGGSWQPCFTDGAPPPPPANGGSWNSNDPGPSVASFAGDRSVTTYSTTLAEPTTANAVAIDESGNVYHYDTGSVAWVQAVMTNGSDNSYVNWTDVEGNQNIVRRVYKASANPPNNPAPRSGDIWIQQQTGFISYLIFNGAAWVSPLAVADYLPTQQALGNGIWSITEKITSSTTVTIRCFLPVSDKPYSYRVTKLVKDDTTSDFTDCQWESFSEVIQSSWTFTSVAMLHAVGVASDQFTTIPAWTADCEGRLVKVPTNYDPVARTYTGVWDGTYKVAYTNNPAWCFKDFVENTSYGLSSVYPLTCNQWSLYEWSQFCDVQVPTMAGGSQPRWTYNDYINQQRDGREAASYIAGAASAIMVDDGAGLIDILIDDPSHAAVAIFGPENVSPEGFKYSYTDRTTRPNQVIVSFANPNVNWQTDKRIVSDATDIATYGTITDDIVAVGCIDPDEALRRARSRLISGLTEKEMVQFTTNRKGKYLKPWDVILVADPMFDRGLSGRVASVLSTTAVQLRDAITLEPGFTYTAYFETPNPDFSNAGDDDPLKVVSLPITTPAGTVTELSFSGNLPPLAEYAIFTIECDNVVGSPKAYRITNIDDAGGDGESIVITALEVNRSKQAYIDGVTDQVTNQNYPPINTTYVAAPTNLQVTVGIQQIGLVSTNVLTLSWEPSSSNLVSHYVVYMSENGSPATSNSTDIPTIQFTGLSNGVITFEVEAVNFNNVSSTPATLIYDFTGIARYVQPPSDLVLVGGTSATTFATEDASFSWSPSNDQLFDHYKVSVIDTGTDAIVRSVNVGSAVSWVYDYGSNIADGLRREFQVVVEAVDQYGDLSAPISITVENPVPVVPIIGWSISMSAILMSFMTPTDPDYAGVNVWASYTSGFTPSNDNLVWNGPGLPTIQGFPGQDIYIRYQFYDRFGTVGCPISNEIKQTFTNAVEFTAPAVPTGLALTTALSSTQVSSITATWDANTDLLFASYNVAISQAGGGFVLFNTTATSYTWVTVPNVSYTVKIQAVDTSGNVSVFSPSVTITSQADTTPPNAPTNLTVEASVGSLYLTWTNPAKATTSQAQVWVNTTNDNTSASLLATVNAAPGVQGSYIHSGLATGATYYYWIKAVDTSGNVSAFSTGTSGTTATLSPTNFPPGLSAIELVSSLPDTGSNGQVVLLETDWQLYRWTGSAWTATVTQVANNSITTGAFAAGAITSSVIGSQTITAYNIAAGTITTDQIKAGTLTGGEFSTTGSLPGTLTITGTGASLTTLANPAARVNAGSTTINPGMISISGSTTLANWRNGTDNTKIEGGSIAANTITANSLRIGSRGINTAGITFSVNTAGTVMSWTAGYVYYTGDDGTQQSAAITAGSTSYLGGWTYIYWAKGATTLSATASWQTAQSDPNVMLAQWQGGVAFSVTYGGTIINGSQITTGSITAAQIAAGSITATQMAAGTITANSGILANASILNAHIANLAVDTLTIKGTAVSGSLTMGYGGGLGGGGTENWFNILSGNVTIPQLDQNNNTGYINIFLQVNMELAGGASKAYGYQIFMDGNLWLQDEGCAVWQSGVPNGSSTCGTLMTAGVAYAGSHNITVKWWGTDSGIVLNSTGCLVQAIYR